MTTESAAFPVPPSLIVARPYPVRVHLIPQLARRDRLTVAFRVFLAIPHLLLVGAPVALIVSWWGRPEGRGTWEAGGGVLGPVAAAAAFIAWFAIVFTGRHPDGLRTLSTFYLGWRVRATAYIALLRDEYPPFEDAPYPAGLEIDTPRARDRVTVAFRVFLALPHILIVWLLGIAWFVTTAIAWCAILLTGNYPEGLYHFGAGVLRWSTRLEAYLLLLTDAYPPFTLE